MANRLAGRQNVVYDFSIPVGAAAAWPGPV